MSFLRLHAEAGAQRALEAAAFRAAMRHLPGGVSIITAGRPGERSGLVATSVSSLSAEPPALIVSINLASSTLPLIRREGAFGVNVLAPSHVDIADRFSGRHGHTGEERYAGAAWTRLVTGAPLLEDALVALDCEVEEILPRHSHAIVLGRVRAATPPRDGDGLVYWKSGYRGLASGDCGT
jgi:flavin reductase (DIM6/NTAB) family NADH-FMN oxidoreductase RutF